MKRFFTGFLGFLLGAGILVSGSAIAASVLSGPQGGTGYGYGNLAASSTLLLSTGNGGWTPYSTSTLGIGGAGTVTSIATTYPILGGPITTTGTLSLAFGTTTTNIWSNLNTFNGGIISTASSTFLNGLTIATTTITAATSTNLAVTALSSALALANPTGGLTNYAGTSCTNQFVRSIGATGAATCATVANTDLANSSVTVTAGGGLSGGGSVALGSSVTLTNPYQISTSSPSISGVAYYTGTTPTTLGSVATSSLGVTSPVTFSGTLGSQIGGVGGSFGCATCVTTSRNINTTYPLTGGGALSGDLTLASALSTTTTNTWSAANIWSSASGFLSSLFISSSTDPTMSNANNIAINTTAASSSIRYFDGTSEGMLYPDIGKSFVYATTTPSGTTTLLYPGQLHSWTLKKLGCSSTGGTANVQLGYGWASSTMVTSTNGATTTLTTISSNNTFAFNQIMYIAIGTFSANTVTNVACTFDQLNGD